MTIPFPAPMGWECPRCHVVNAPHIMQCTCVGTTYTWFSTVPGCPHYQFRVTSGGLICNQCGGALPPLGDT